MKLIREEIESVEFLVENRNGKKSMYIEGVFLQGDIKNRNGRMYPMETLRKEVGRYNENHVQSGRALGELGHQVLFQIERDFRCNVQLPYEEFPSDTFYHYGF